eukprot:5718106-Pyramimonas_sp.AAC.1
MGQFSTVPQACRAARPQAHTHTWGCLSGARGRCRRAGAGGGGRCVPGEVAARHPQYYSAAVANQDERRGCRAFA